VEGVPWRRRRARSFLAQVARLEERGGTGINRHELEFIVFEDHRPTSRPGGRLPRSMTPVTPSDNVDYSIQGRRASNRCSVASGARCARRHGRRVVKGECNFGPTTKSPSSTTRSSRSPTAQSVQTGAKEIAAQEGVSLTFMAKYDQREGKLLSHSSLAAR